MVECAALEMRCTGNRTVGSNPTLSAICPFATVHDHPKNRNNYRIIRDFCSRSFATVRLCPKTNVGLSVVLWVSGGLQKYLV